MARKSREITIRVMPKEADTILRNGFFDHPLERRIIKSIRGEFEGLVDEITVQRRAEYILKKMKAKPAYEEMLDARKKAAQPFHDEIERLDHERRVAEAKVQATFDRTVNHELHKAGIEGFYCQDGYIHEITMLHPGNWQYGRTAIYGEKPGYSY